MSDDFRLKDGRLITEEQHRKEFLTAFQVRTASQYSYMTIPAGLITAAVVFISLLRSDYPWFWSLVGAAVSGFLVYLYIIPLILLCLLAIVIFALYLIISATNGFG